MADPDKVRTLYFWGYELDEKLTERIRELKWSLQEPALPFIVPPSGEFYRTRLEAALTQLTDDVPCVVQAPRGIAASPPGDGGGPRAAPDRT